MFLSNVHYTVYSYKTTDSQVYIQYNLLEDVFQQLINKYVSIEKMITYKTEHRVHQLADRLPLWQIKVKNRRNCTLQHVCRSQTCLYLEIDICRIPFTLCIGAIVSP